MRKLLVAVPLLSLVIMACDGRGPPGSAPTESGQSGGLIGNPAPDFTVPAVHNARGSIRLSRLKGKVVILDFWGTFCEPCKQSFPKLQSLSAKYKSSGLEIIGISEDEPEDKDKIPAFANAHNAHFPLAFDEGKVVARQYGPTTMPTSYVIDKRGVVRYTHLGFHEGDEVQIENEVRELLQER